MELLNKVIAGQDLTENEMMQMMTLIMKGEMTDIHISSFLTALKMKGEAISEIVGGAKVMRHQATRIHLEGMKTLDTCGTGGDHFGTYNISTAVALVAAAAGIKVVKHGNRSVSSQCGCADVLETVGVKIDLLPEQVEDCIKKTGIGFLFAPTFHPAMRHVMPTRRALGFRTIFNILGPLANPAHANYQIVGVFDEALMRPFAEVLKALGVERALVVHGDDGLDEITLTTTTKVLELSEGTIKSYTISPEDFGLERSTMEELLGGDSNENAEILRQVLSGERGPKRDILLMNAGAALYIAQVAPSIKEGIKIAAHILDHKKALELLGILIINSQSYKTA